MRLRDTTRPRPWRALLAVAALCFAAPCWAAPVTLPDFTIENAFPGASFVNPTALAFMPDGRLLVGDKAGMVRIIRNGVMLPTPFWDGRAEVLGNGDRGLMGMAVDPDYVRNHRVYFFFTADPEADNVDTNMVAYARLLRFETSAGDSNKVDPASRRALLGATWGDGVASPTLVHAADCLRFGEDGSLFVTHGENAHHDRIDPGGTDPGQWLPGRSNPNDDIGSFRAQDPSSMNGKLLRINPETGHGYAGNPFAAGNLAAPAAKVWAYGFRNPFRACVRPGTGSRDTADVDPGTVYVSDVGDRSWEELSAVPQGGLNFGWPCREGLDHYPAYEAATPAHHGCNSIGTPANPSLPGVSTFSWHHTDSTRSVPYGLKGNCASGALFYTGANYPAHYRGRLFFTDFGGSWARVATVDSLDRVIALQDFASGLDGPVDCAADPLSGDIFYASIYTGEVRRIRYTGSGASLPPVAHASADTIYGATPAVVQFSSLGSFDPGGAPLHFAWSFGDGSPGSTDPAPVHTYTSGGEWNAILTASRDDGALARDTVRLVIVSRAGHPVTDVLDAFERADGPLGAPWAGALTGLSVQGGAMVQTAASNYATWNGTVFGGNQEVFVRLGGVTPTAPEHDLLLKVQGTSWNTGCVQVVWAPSNGSMVVNTYTPGTGFTRRGGPWRDVQFAPGDMFGARAYANGVVEVFKNGVVIATTSIAAWPQYRVGGRIGVLLRDGAQTRIDAFGGGNLPIIGNAVPHAVLIAPVDGGFFAEGTAVALTGAGVDAEDPPSALSHHWDVSLRHNNHVHPSIHEFDGTATSFVPENHDDGTGTSLIIRLRVTDTGGASADTTVTIWPEVDLVPSPITTVPALPTGTGTTQYRFAIKNLGRMPAPFSRWWLVADGVAIAAGDTLVPPRDSVVIVRTLAALAEGTHLLRVVVDSLAAVRETDETNNRRVQVWAPVSFPSARVLDTFERTDGPIVAPWVGSIGGLRVRALALEQTAAVSYAVWSSDVFGPEQEAFVRFETIAETAAEHDLLLKVQGASWTAGCVQLVYSAPQRRLVVNTYAAGQGWVRRGTWTGVRFLPGDQMGARCDANGAVIAYRNGVVVGSASLAGWPFATQGGRIGLLLSGAATTRLVDFGGGNVTPPGDTPPRARIIAPAAPAFAVPGAVVSLRGTASDAEDIVKVLRYRWRADLGGTPWVRTGAMESLTVPAAEDALPLVVRMIATDRHGMCDTADVVVQREVDLSPGPIVTSPAAALGTGTTRYRFAIRNLGRMAAPASRWTLAADNVTIALGDTAVPARDSVWIERTLPALPIGVHELRVVVDALGAVPELREDDNTRVRAWGLPDFPSTFVIDAFERSDGPPWNPWVGMIGAYAVQGGALVSPTGSGYLIWNGAVFGPDQEAFVRFDSVTATAPEHDLLLKVQGASWTAGTIQVVYAAHQSLVVVTTYAPGQGWVRRGGPWRDVRVEAGQELGARALADGSVEVFRDGVSIGSCVTTGWPFATGGGRIGVMLSQAPRTRIGAFGGGAVGERVSAAYAAALARSRGTIEGAARPVVDVAPDGAPRLSFVWPNPVRSMASLALDLPRPERVRLAVYDVTGRLVWRGPDRELSSGRSILHWPGIDLDGRTVAAGAYVARVVVGTESLQRRLVVVR